MMSNLKKLMNASEAEVNERLETLCEASGARVFIKVRVADVLPINGSGISDGDFSYALKAHFDFVVANAESDPLFAVEFDGPRHATGRQSARDERKNRLCKRFDFPLLRIVSRYVSRSVHGMNLLTWLVEVWFAAEDFQEAREDGQVQYDEPFDPMFILRTSGRDQAFPYWLARPALVQVQRWSKAGRCLDPTVSHYVGTTDSGAVRAIGYVRIDEERGVLAKSGLYSFYFGFFMTDLVGDLVQIDTYEALRRVLNGAASPIPMTEIDEKLASFHAEHRILRGGWTGESRVETEP